MKKSTLVKTAALAAAGIAGWYLTGNSRKGQVERVRREVYRLLSVRRDELNALREAAKQGEFPSDALGPVPLDGVELDAIRVEDGAAVLVLRGGRAAAWLASQPLDVLTDVRCVPWRGSARPGVLYTEHLGDGWYAGYACLGWN
ncbi:toxin-antitoxin system antitoxin subunit [Flavonifractor sp. An306]|uniref:toxin-antitoxin system antitoxin subunit n=1 Tax=Flavonifractor sp. An306 TaxID=1965629 RepID=UPI000B392CB7|nr:toxin-antitoxin system antitoxin subunit [Flavonifractor sp. An306]OUO31083.1 toxin-antitoxin system antitoxin subunit [Flavonifractor sp. An306]